LQVEALAEPGERAATSPIEGFPLADDRFQTVGQEGADRPALLCGDDTGFAQKVRVEFKSDVSLHSVIDWHVMSCSTILRAMLPPCNLLEAWVLLRSRGLYAKGPQSRVFVEVPNPADQICFLGVKTVNTMRLTILTVLVLGTIGLAPADACTCAPPRAPCAEYWRVSAVFAGTVREIRPVPERPGMLAVQFDVDQRGRGVDSDTVVVESAPQNGVNCGYTFTVGQRYVVYAQSAPGGQLTTNMCSGTKLASAAAIDLAFLKEVTEPPRGVRVFGHVRRVEYDLVSFNRRDYGGVAGARVQLVGDRVSREGISGPDGDYDFRDLPAGTYKVTVTPPKGLALAGPPLPREHHHPPPPWSVALTNPSECAEVWTWPRTDAQISGVLLNSNGRPADDEAIELIAADNATRRDKQIPHVSVRTDADGRFTFAFIAPGRYLAGVNLKNPPPASQVDHRSYHPGVTDPSRATVVSIDTGSRVQLTPFQAPQWPQERRISGVVVWSDGTPAPDAQLTLTGARSERVQLDAAGRFSVTLALRAQFTLMAQASRIVDGRRVTGSSPYHQIGRQDREAEITLVLKTTR
jgi:hypothetical protein